ncbi:MAG: DNA-protecting protein DprA [Rickettsiales bacterium]|jgi:DNA processing protein|nr:DNA-protecting protein DprA [Rickettsiales bacterium]
MNDELFYKLLVFRTKGIGAVKYHELIRDCGGAEAAVESLQVSGELMDKVRREMELAESMGIAYVADDSPEFPEVYKKARNHSPILSVRGNMKTLRKKTAGMVGTRHATAAGIKFMSELAREFARHDFAVVSGMAIGTDGAAHEGALSAAGGAQTIAVLAGGADYIWPPENESLYWRMVERGCVVSDMGVGFIPVANNFIARNRVVAGLSELLILGEADEKSGSVATAKMALEIGRELWAIPSHPSDERSQGPNRFIKEGLAKLCSGADDFFHDASGAGKNKKNLPDSALADFIGSVPVSESVLTSLVKKNISEIMSELVSLELSGLIKKVNGGYVRV